MCVCLHVLYVHKKTSISLTADDLWDLNLKWRCPLKCSSDSAVPRRLCFAEAAMSDIVIVVAIMSIQRWRIRGQASSGGPQCLVPAKSNVTGFPEPLLAFYVRELMENYIICFPKHIHYCNKGRVCFPPSFWQGRACKSPLKLLCGRAAICIHTHRTSKHCQRHLSIFLLETLFP